MKNKKIALVITVLVIVLGLALTDLNQYWSLEFIKAQQSQLEGFHEQNPAFSGALFFIIYVIMAGLSLPGAAVMTLVGGAIFGVTTGTVLVSFASTLGATLAFLVSRFLLRDAIQKRFGSNLAAVNNGIAKDGAFYLFTLRLVPAFPFFVVNLVMGLTPIRTWTFYWVSQIGMFPATVIYVNAGTQLAQLESLNGLLSPGLVFSLALLGVFPLLARHVLARWRARKTMIAYPRPRRFDRNLIVIGAGSAGLVTAYIAAAVKAKVTLIEKHRMGGDCLNTGCVPSKALIRSAKFLAQVKHASELGAVNARAEFDFSAAMERVQNVIKRIEPHDSVERYSALGVECMQGEARVVSPYSVEIDGRTLTARNLVIATGARPFVPPIEGLDRCEYYTSDTIWTLRKLPRRFVILGGGPIGCELAQCFARFGSQVTQIEAGPRLLAREDADVAEVVAAKFRSEGIDVRSGHRAQRVRIEGDRRWLICETASGPQEVEFDALLVAVGRIANVTGFGLEQLGVRVNRTIEVNEFLQTNVPSIFACGDVAGPFQFTHTAAHQAWYAAVNSLFGGVKKFRADYSVIPWATFTDPEVARVGMNEQDANAQGIPYEVTRFEFAELDRAIADEATQGFIKVLTVPGKDRILGATLVGEHAGDLIAEFVLAMRYKLGLKKILGTIHIYPTLAEGNKYAAGLWQRNHQPTALLAWVARYHDWRRDGLRAR